MIAPDPPIRSDGRCVECLGPRRLPRGLHRFEASMDPFYSTECCRSWHQVNR